MSKIPPGTRLLSEEERQKTLTDLEDTKVHVVTALERFPIMLPNVHRSAKMSNQKEALEIKLERLTKAIATYSSPPVYISLFK